MVLSLFQLIFEDTDGDDMNFVSNVQNRLIKYTVYKHWKFNQTEL